MPKENAQDPSRSPSPAVAYELLLDAIDRGEFVSGDRMVESELADRFGFSRTPIREALQRLETQGILARDGRSLFVATLSHDQLGELYTVRSELEALAARLAAQHASAEEISVLRKMASDDRALLGNSGALARANKRFHKMMHQASHNRYLVQQLDMVHRAMVLFSTTSLDVPGRDVLALDEHDAVVAAIAARDGDAAAAAIKLHISHAYETRLRRDAERLG